LFILTGESFETPETSTDLPRPFLKPERVASENSTPSFHVRWRRT